MGQFDISSVSTPPHTNTHQYDMVQYTKYHPVRYSVANIVLNNQYYGHFTEYQIL